MLQFYFVFYRGWLVKGGGVGNQELIHSTCGLVDCRQVRGALQGHEGGRVNLLGHFAGF